MGSSQEPTFSSVSTATQVNACALDSLPVYAKELITSGAAGAFAKTAVEPLERVKILLQTRTEGFQSLGILQSLRKLWQYEGIRAFYKGNVGTGPIVDLLAGSATGGTTVLCTYPLYLARTKLVCQVSNVAQPSNVLGNSGRHPTYSGIKDVFKAVYREGGARSLYRGVGPRNCYPPDYSKCKVKRWQTPMSLRRKHHVHAPCPAGKLCWNRHANLGLVCLRRPDTVGISLIYAMLWVSVM